MNGNFIIQEPKTKIIIIKKKKTIEKDPYKRRLRQHLKRRKTKNERKEKTNI